MKFESLPPEVRNALTKRGVSETEFRRMSAAEIFREFCLWEGLLGSWSDTLWQVTAKLREIETAEKRARLQADNQHLKYWTDAWMFVEDIAQLSIWDYDRDSGTPYQECAEPSDGHLDSHVAFMQIIEKARRIKHGKASA